jgi:hypothetical protein
MANGLGSFDAYTKIRLFPLPALASVLKFFTEITRYFLLLLQEALTQSKLAQKERA